MLLEQNCDVSDGMSDVAIKDANYVATREELSSGRGKMAWLFDLH